MGRFTYDSTTVVDFEDRLLAHLQIVIGSKLRRGEPFYFSWKDDQAVGDGRTSVWIHPSLPISFKYVGSRAPAINRAWLDALMETTHSTGGLYIVPEPEAPAS